MLSRGRISGALHRLRVMRGCLPAFRPSARGWRPTFLRERGEGAGACIDTCFSEALQMSGSSCRREVMTSDRRQAFYETSEAGHSLRRRTDTRQRIRARDTEGCRERDSTPPSRHAAMPMGALEVASPVTDLS